MTKEALEQYADKREELEELKRQVIQAHRECPEEVFPLGLKMHRRLVSLAEQAAKTEKFAAGLPWSKRRLVQAVMKYGTRWDVIRREIHSGKSPDALRKEYVRIFEKI